MASALPPGGSQSTARGAIQIDTNDLQRVQVMSRQVGADVARNLGQISAGTQKAESGFRAMGGSLVQLAASYVSLRTAQIAIDWGKEAAFAERTAQAYQTLSGGAANATRNLAALQTGANNSLSTLEAQRIALQAQALGLATTSKEFEQLATAARAVTFVSPVIRDMSGAISEIALAGANMSWRRLDQLGLSVTEVRKRFEELRREQSALTENQAFSLAVIQTLNTKYADLVKTGRDNAAAFEQAAAQAKDAQIAIGQMIQPAAISAVETYTDALIALGIALAAVGRLAGFNPDMSGLMPNMRYTWSRGRSDTSRSTGGFNRSAPGGETGRSLEAEQRTAALDWFEGVQEIERQAGQARQETAEQYESQRTQTIRSYEQTIAREAEDFARQRARQIAALERGIADVRADAAQREARAERDYIERVAELREDANKRLSDQEERYQRDRVRAERDHRDRLFDAAARLDAVAVFEEQRRFARESQDAAENHGEQRRAALEQLAEREADERKSHERRLQDAREADAQRIEDLREAFERQRQEEDEDRAQRLERMRQDHAQQLADLDRQHGQRLAQIDRQAAEERRLHDGAFRRLMTDLGLQNDSLRKLYDAREKAALDAFNRFWDGVERRFKPEVAPNPRRSGGGGYGGFYADGGWVRQTERALVHAGEFVLSRQMLAALGSRGPGSMMTSAASSQSLSIEAGAIQVYAAPGMDEGALAAAVEARLVELLRRVSA